MHHKWIVGLDGSDTATAALRWATTNAPAHDTKVVAIRAWHLPIALRALMTKRGIDVDRLGLAATAGHETDDTLASLGDLAIGVESFTLEGHPAAVLLEHAKLAALLVLGTRGMSELESLVLGSVTRYCTTHSTIPVVVVPPGWEPKVNGEIVVGFDGSEHSRDALRWALEFCLEEQTVRVVVALDVAPWLDEDLTGHRYPDETEAEVTLLTDALDAVDPERRAERHMVLHGPHQALTDASADAALVVVGARGRGLVGPKILGSVSTWMLHQMPCPVVVVPHGRREGGEHDV